jgi:hypothetical protein
VKLASLYVGIRAFLGYDFAYPLPSQSTISRTRQPLPNSVFEACFTHVVDLYVQQCLHASLGLSLYQDQRVPEWA